MCIFQSEQIIKLRFWLKIFKSPDLNPLDYHVRYNTRTMRKPTNIAELKTALHGMICHRSSLIRPPCDFERDFDFVLLQLAVTVSVNTQFKYWEGNWHSLLKHLKCWRKNCAKFDSLLSKTYWIFKEAIACSLEKKWTLKFKLLYLLNRICYFNKICRICGLNPYL